MKWIDCNCNVIHIPAATISAIFLCPGTSVTHEACKVLASCNCNLCWVGEDCLHSIAVSVSPTHDSRGMQKQCAYAFNAKKSLEVARKLFAYRIKDVDLSGKSLQELMGLEGSRVKELYRLKALQYDVPWHGRSYVPGKYSKSDVINRRLTQFNAFLYGLVTSTIISMGYSPYIGFIHKGSPLPLTYNLADLYKENLCIDLVFSWPVKYCSEERRTIVSAFIERCIETDVLNTMQKDLAYIME